MGNSKYVNQYVQYTLWIFYHNALCLSTVTMSLDTIDILWSYFSSIILQIMLVVSPRVTPNPQHQEIWKMNIMRILNVQNKINVRIKLKPQIWILKIQQWLETKFQINKIITIVNENHGSR